MKTKKTLTGLLILLALTLATPMASNAQHRHYHHPHWADVHSCRIETRNVYFPAYNFYYDMDREMFIYLSGDRWVFSLNLPVAFAHIDLAYEPMVELDFYDANPYLYNHDHIIYYRDYHNHYGRHDYREYGHNHDYYRHGHRDYDYNRHGDDRGGRPGYDRKDYGNRGDNNYDHRSDGKHYEKKGNDRTYSNHNNNSQRNGNNGNGRSGNGRGGNERGGRGNGNGNNGKGHRM